MKLTLYEMYVEMRILRAKQHQKFESIQVKNVSACCCTARLHKL